MSDVPFGVLQSVDQELRGRIAQCEGRLHTQVRDWRSWNLPGQFVEADHPDVFWDANMLCAQRPRGMPRLKGVRRGQKRVDRPL